MAADGRGVPQARKAATFVYLVADALVLLLLSLCAKGWNIVRRKLSFKTRIQVCVFMTTYVCMTVVVFTWHVVSADPALSVYIYDSPPGYLLVCMRGVAGGLS